MRRFETILLPVDFSEKCQGAARYAEALARHTGGRIVLLHVLEPAPAQPADLYFGGATSLIDIQTWTDRANNMLARFRETELSHVPVEIRLEAGDPASVITDIAAALPADLIALPTHGYGRFRRFILGSVTAKVLHDSSCPVWTGVHLEKAPEAAPISIRSIVCGLELDESAPRVLEAARFTSSDFQATLAVVHAVPGTEAIPKRSLDNEFRSRLKAEARSSIHALLEEQNVKGDVFIDDGDPAAALRRAAEEHKADLVIIGRGHHAGLGRLRTHSYAIIRESPCPVLSI